MHTVPEFQAMQLSHWEVRSWTEELQGCPRLHTIETSCIHPPTHTRKQTIPHQLQFIPLPGDSNRPAILSLYSYGTAQGQHLNSPRFILKPCWFHSQSAFGVCVWGSHYHGNSVDLCKVRGRVSSLGLVLEWTTCWISHSGANVSTIQLGLP